MTKLMVQSFLETHGLGDLRAYHGVKARWSEKRPNTFTLNYDQIEVVDADPISQQCRGLILRSEKRPSDDEPIGPTTIVARPFDRFFNHGQGACAEVDFDRARFYEKVDGTLCIVHHDLGAWHVATRSVPDADVAMDGDARTFRALYEEALPSGVTLGMHLDPDMTYMFELTAPENQIVVFYPERSVTLLGIRETATGREVDPIRAPAAYKVCRWHPLSPQTMIEWVNARDPSQHEGLVVCDDQFRRCKVKSLAYLALSKVRDGVGKSPRNMMELILAGKDDDARGLLPAYLLEKLDAMKAGLVTELARMDASYNYLRPHNDDRKAFALRIQASAHPSDMGHHMARFGGKVGSAHEWVQGQRKNGAWSDSVLDALIDRSVQS